MKRKTKQPPCPDHPRFLLKYGTIMFWVNDDTDQVSINKLTHAQREEAACIAECWFRRLGEKIELDFKAGILPNPLLSPDHYDARMSASFWRDWLNERGGMCT